jgi:uncharacterized membrane protein YkvA (DUF1232 family)
MFRLWRLWRAGGRDLRVMWYALRHPRRPLWLLPVSALLTLYALEPLNFELPLLGFVDDLVLLPLMLHWIVRFIPAELRPDFDPLSTIRAGLNSTPPGAKPSRGP